MTPEQEEMIRNARTAYKAGNITKQQLHDVYFIIARDMAEKELQCITTTQPKESSLNPSAR